MRTLLAVGLCMAAVAAPLQAEARDNIKIVGSSTVYPFTNIVAAKMLVRGVETDLKSTGTRAGFNGFCLGSSDWWPDMTNASRPITETERESCARRGVTDIVELRIGYDGIVVARSNEAPTVDLTRKDLFLALAEQIPADGVLVENPNTEWPQVNPALPEGPILVYGPPPSSGTRQSFEGLALSHGCRAAQEENPVLLEEVEALDFCTTLRGEPHFVEAGEDDNEIVQALRENADAYGIFGFSFAFNNTDTIHANPIDGVTPSPSSISDTSYPLSRPLFLYVKAHRVRELPALQALLEEYFSDAALGPDGYLTAAGLVPLSAEELEQSRATLASLLQTTSAE